MELNKHKDLIISAKGKFRWRSEFEGLEELINQQLGLETISGQTQAAMQRNSSRTGAVSFSMILGIYTIFLKSIRRRMFYCNFLAGCLLAF